MAAVAVLEIGAHTRYGGLHFPGKCVIRCEVLVQTACNLLQIPLSPTWGSAWFIVAFL